MTGDVSWTFTTAAALQVTSRTPAPLATGVAPRALVRATFSRALDPATVTAASVRLATSDGTSVPASVSYDASSTSTTLTPTSALALATTYTATITTAVTAADGTPLTAAVTWSFSTAMTAPTAPTVTAHDPGGRRDRRGHGHRGVGHVRPRARPGLGHRAVRRPQGRGRDRGVGERRLRRGHDHGPPEPHGRAGPGQGLHGPADDGHPRHRRHALANAVSWGFTTADCPCSLMGTTTPAVNEDVRDGRTGTGPFTYELGTKITVDKTMSLVALRFYKHALETGTHVGRVWSSGGTQLASVTVPGRDGVGLAAPGAWPARSRCRRARPTRCRSA